MVLFGCGMIPTVRMLFPPSIFLVLLDQQIPCRFVRNRSDLQQCGSMVHRLHVPFLNQTRSKDLWDGPQGSGNKRRKGDCGWNRKPIIDGLHL